MTEPTAVMSRVHRFMVDDVVALTHDGHELENMVTNLEGKIVAFANEELTHLTVLWADGTTADVTEDELRRTGA